MIEQRVAVGTGIGFGAEVRKMKDEAKSAVQLFKQVEPEDLVKYGSIPEFIGRLPVTTTLTELDEEALIRILCEPKNALTKQYGALLDFEDSELEFREDALQAIAKKAMERKTGARGLRSILESSGSARNHV